MNYTNTPVCGSSETYDPVKSGPTINNLITGTMDVLADLRDEISQMCSVVSDIKAPPIEKPELNCMKDAALRMNALAKESFEMMMKLNQSLV